MLGYSKTLLLGNLGKDPEIRFTPSGVKVARFTLATNKRWKDKEGKPRESTEWHYIVLWRGGADVAEKYLRKGSSLFVEGENKTRTWTDKNNIKRNTTEIQANEIRLIGGDRTEIPGAEDFNPEMPLPDDEERNTQVAGGDVSDYI
jgi:single-strand DNA-binding protein